MIKLPGGEKGFDTIPACDRRTDRHLAGHCPYYAKDHVAKRYRSNQIP